MTFTRAAALSALLFCCAGPASAQSVRLEFHDGKVNLIAQNASLRAILTEWARQGGTQVVNMERLAGPPVTLQLTDVPEMQALDTILRGTAGYIAGQRTALDAPGARSTLDRILIVPTAGTAAAVNSRPAAAPPPFGAVQRFPQPQPQPQPDPDDDPVSDEPPDDEPPPNRGTIRVNAPPNGPRGPNQPPQRFEPDDDDAPESEPAPTTPSNPFGVQPGSSRPGTITPVPQQPERPRSQPDPEP
jgi:hypothetical protein